jgi:uncharacterized protein (DUF1778 family)
MERDTMTNTKTNPDEAVPAVTRISKDGRLNLRVTARQEMLIRRAAAAVDKSVTEFVLDSVALQAERVLAERRWFVLSESDWERFNELIDAPVQDDGRLRSLLTTEVEVDLTDL